MEQIIVNVTEPTVILWLNNFKRGDKAPIVNKALMEYKARHYDGQYFTVKEIEADIKKKEHEIKKLEDALKLYQDSKEIEDEDGEQIPDNV